MQFFDDFWSGNVFCDSRSFSIIYARTTSLKFTNTLLVHLPRWRRCHKLFTEGQEEINDDARPGRPSTSTTNENTEAVKKIIMKNRRITIREVAEDVNI